MNKLRFNEFLLLITFKVLLEVSYVHFVSPLYEYTGFSLDLNMVKLFESYISLTVLFFCLPQGEKKISTVGFQLLFLLMIVPSLSLYALINGPRIYLYFFIASFCLTMSTVKIFPIVKMKKIKNANFILFFLLGIISIFVYIVLLKLNGVPNLRAIALSTVYEIRSEVNYGSEIMGYLLKWQANVINCFLIGLAWYKRKYFVMLLVLGLQVVLFLICAHKSFLFSPFLVLFLLYAIERKQLMLFSLASLVIVILFCFALYELKVTNFPASMFIRRVLFVPARISFSYYDFFSKNEYLYLSHSKMGFGLMEDPYEDYDMSVAHMMGMIYSDNPEKSMNTGYLGEAYMNFGFGGMLIFSLMLGLVFVVADSISKKTSITIAIAAIAMPIVSLVNGAFLSRMLTGGFLLSLFVLWLYQERTKASLGTRRTAMIDK